MKKSSIYRAISFYHRYILLAEVYKLSAQHVMKKERGRAKQVSNSCLRMRNIKNGLAFNRNVPPSRLITPHIPLQNVRR